MFFLQSFLTSKIKFNFKCLHYNLDASTINGYWMLRCYSLLHTTYMQLWAFSLYSFLDTSLNVWNLVESLRTEVFRAHLGHCKDTQNNKHCKEMLGIYHFDEQIWFIPQPFRVKTDLWGIIPSLLLNSLLHSTSIFLCIIQASVTSWSTLDLGEKMPVSY